MINLSSNILGAVIMTFSMLVYVLNDAFMKIAGPEVGLFQSIFIRGLMVVSGFILFGLVLKYPLLHVPKKVLKPLLTRGVIEIMLTCCFMTAIFNMPLANAIAILQAMPLIISMVASKLGGQRLPKSRLAIIIIGLIGVLIILMPGTKGFNYYSIFALVAVFLLVLRDLLTTKIPKDISAFQVAFFTALQITLVSGIACCFIEWTTVQIEIQITLSVAAFFIGFGYLASVAAIRYGDISFSAPFRYSSLLWALLIGILFFGEFPTMRELFGSMVIVICGIYIIVSDTRAQKIYA